MVKTCLKPIWLQEKAVCAFFFYVLLKKLYPLGASTSGHCQRTTVVSGCAKQLAEKCWDDVKLINSSKWKQRCLSVQFSIVAIWLHSWKSAFDPLEKKTAYGAENSTEPTALVLSFLVVLGLFITLLSMQLV